MGYFKHKHYPYSDSYREFIMPKLRLPLQVDVKNRNDDIVKDSSITNGFIEQTTSNKIYTMKRPGLGFVASGAGTANGTFNYNNVLYVWDSGVSNTSPRILAYIPGYGFGTLYSSGFTYTLNSPPIVALDDADGTYKLFYPMIPSSGTGGVVAAPSTLAGSAGSYAWATFPNITGHTYYGNYGSNGAVCGSKIAAAYSAYERNEQYKTCATKAIATGLYRTFSGVGPGYYGPDSILLHQWVDVSGNCSGAPVDFGIAAFGTVITI